MLTIDFDEKNFFIVRTIDSYSNDMLVISKNMYKGSIKNYSLSLLNKEIQIIGVDDI